MLLAAVALGLALGAVTGMPLGVINVAIVDAAAGGRRRFATGIGLGGGIADAIHAGLAFAGIGALLAARPELLRAMAVVAALAISAYAVVAWRRRAPSTARAPDGTSRARGVLVGLSLTLPNPAPLVAWGAIAASLWPRATPAEAIALAAGVGVGSAAWFAILARWIAGIRPGHPALRIVPQAALAALLALALVGVVRY